VVTIFAANNAEVYQQHMGRWSRRLAVGFTEFAAIGNPGSILDVGCGTGSLTFQLAERFPHARLTGNRVRLIQKRDRFLSELYRFCARPRSRPPHFI
jgi:trans-aconitate methyltransferase